MPGFQHPESLYPTWKIILLLLLLLLFILKEKYIGKFSQTYD